MKIFTYMKLNLNKFNKNNFVKSFNNIYESNGIRYSNYNIEYNQDKISILYNYNKYKYQDNKKINTIANPYEGFLINILIDITNNIKNITYNNKYDIDVYQIRYDVNSNSMNNLITNNNDYLIPCLLLSKVNTSNLTMSVYTNCDRKLEDNYIDIGECLLINNNLHYSLSNPYYIHSTFENRGYIDMLRIGLNVYT